MAQLLSSLKDYPDSFRGGAVAIGNFDGVHRGHACLIAELVTRARQLNGPAVILTFDPPPVAILVPSRPPSTPLTSIQRRAELLGQLGVDVLIAYPTDRALLALSPQQFFRRMVVETVGARAIVEGPNFRFGKNREGDTRLLSRLCDESDLELIIVHAQSDDGQNMISSTRIRALLSEGNIGEANSLLTQPYRIEGIVTKGSQRGRDLGFPTANLESVSCLIPAHGVYAGAVSIDDRHVPAAVNIGPNPTFGEKNSKVEIHLIGWSGTLYGEHLICSLIDKIRDIHKFQSIEALQEQLAKDIAECQHICASMNL